jgi:hypothetical protein
MLCAKFFVLSLFSQLCKRDPKRPLHPSIESQVIGKPQLGADFTSAHALVGQPGGDVFLSALINELFDRHALAAVKDSLEISGIYVEKLGHFFQ